MGAVEGVVVDHKLRNQAMVIGVWYYTSALRCLYPQPCSVRHVAYMDSMYILGPPLLR